MAGLYDPSGNPTLTFYVLKAYQLRAVVATELGSHANMVDISAKVVMPIFKESGNAGVMDYFRKKASAGVDPKPTGRPHGWTAAEEPPDLSDSQLAAQHGWPDLGYMPFPSNEPMPW